MNPKHLAAALLLLVSLPAAGAITGTVIDGDGRPVAGARVSIYGWESALAARTRLLSASPERVPIASIQADARGNFTIPSPKDAVVHLAVSARGYEPKRRAIERDEDLGAVVLAPAETKTVTVTAAGKPVSGAVVSVRYDAFEHTVKTDEQGRAEVPDIRRASSILVFHPEFAVDSEAFSGRSGAPASELSRTLNAGTPRKGKVVDLDGKSPVALATVVVDGWPLATTGEDGSFTIPHLGPKWSMIVVKKGGNFGLRAWQASGELPVRMARGASISGRVTDAKSGLPLPSAAVTASTRRFDGPPDLPADAITDAKGGYVLQAPAGSYMIAASHPAYTGQPGEKAASSGEKAVRDMALKPLSRISGVVVDEEARPVAMASVVPDLGGPMGMFTGGMMFRDAWPSVTLPDGRFVVRTSAERELRLRATKKGLPAATSDAIRVAAGERKSGVVITMPAGIEVTGVVTDVDRNPLSGVAVVTAEAQVDGRARQIFIGGPPVRDDDALRTGSDGRYSIRVKEGRWDFSFRREGYATTNVRAQRIGAGERNEVDAELGPAVEISGRVVRGGSPVEGVALDAFGGSDDATAITGPDGSFTLGGLTPGPVGVAIRKQDDLVQEMRNLTAPARDLVIELPEGETVAGRVVEKGSKRPVTSFQAGISVSRGGGGMMMMAPPLLRSFTSDDGSFVLEHVPTGAVNLVATAPGFTEGRSMLNVESGRELTGLEIELEKGVRLFGKVTAANGTPVSDARVQMVPAPGTTAMPSMRLRATTDASGEYSIDSLQAGEQVVEVSSESHGSTRKNVTLKLPEVRLDLQLEQGLKLTGVVVDESGAAVADAEVDAWATGRGRNARSRTDGTFEMEGLTPGRYSVSAGKTGYAPATLDDFDVTTGTPARLVLRAGGAIYGRVSGVEASHLAQTVVRAVGADAYLDAPVDPTGNYRIEGVPPGTFQVSASIRSAGFGGSRSTASQTVVLASAGSQQVDLEFRDDVVISGRVTRNGSPISGAVVSFGPKTAASQTAATATTEQDGFYEISGLTEGEYNVAVIDLQRFSPYYTTTTVRGSGTFDIDFTAAAVRGRVIDASTNEPIASANVDFRPQSMLENLRAGRGALSDPSGSFAIDFVAPGTYLVTVSRDGYGNAVREMTVGDNGVDGLEFRLSRSDGVAFRIADGRDGRALRGWVVVMDSPGRIVYDSRGMMMGGSMPDEVRVPLSPGPYVAAVGSWGYATRMVNLTSPSVQNVGLTPGGTLLIESKHGQRRRFRLVSGGQQYLHSFSRSGKFDLLPQPGTTTVPNVAAGSYVIELLSEDETTVVGGTQVVVQEGGTAKAEL